MTTAILRSDKSTMKRTLYLFLQPGTGQAKGFSSPPFMHMELKIDSELMALSVVHDSSLSDASNSTSSSSHSLPVGRKTTESTKIYFRSTASKRKCSDSWLLTSLWQSDLSPWAFRLANTDLSQQQFPYSSFPELQYPHFKKHWNQPIMGKKSWVEKRLFVLCIH